MADDRTTNPNKTVITNVGIPGSGSSKKSNSRDACLVVIYGDDLGKRVALGNAPIVLGRSAKCELQIDQESISRNHCRVSSDGHRYSIRDLGSTNGTYVNDELIEAHELRDGDQIKVGRCILKFITGGNVEGQYHEEIYRLMTTDGLTQVNNKRAFDEAMERELSRAKRYDRIFSLVLFDIDHFKKINDSQGHLAGDAVLRQLGSLMLRQVRRDDIVCRIGGEEFAIIAPEVGHEGALDFAKKLCRCVAEAKFEFEGQRIPVTISLGVAEWNLKHESARSLLQVADQFLYEAKRSGRNKVCG